MRDSAITALIQSLTQGPSSSEILDLPPIEEWIKVHFGRVASKPLADRHRTLYRWFEGLEPGKLVPPSAHIMPRGGGKSTSGQIGVTYVGLKGTRKFALYVSGTQDQANKHVQAVAALLEKVGVERAISKYGHSKGWNVSMLRASNGFNVVALGLDAAVRGVKLDEFRPDLIVLDDIDALSDSPRAVRKKVETLTGSILPAGSTDVAVILLQNQIHEESIATQLVEARADFLLNCEVPVLEPAAHELVTERVDRGDGRYVHKVVSGKPTWEGQDLSVIEQQINTWGLATFLRESQHEVRGADGVYFDVSKLRYCDPHEVPEGLVCCRGWDLAATQAGGDFTAGPLLGLDLASELIYVLDLKHEQYATNDVRSLIDRCSEQDDLGEIYEADVKKQSGAFDQRGRLYYRFTPKGRVTVRLPQDPGAAGKAQASQFAEDLTGQSLAIKAVTGAKAVRARGWQEQVNLGNVIIVRGDWNHAFEREHRKFREDEDHEFDDIVDGCADAYNYLRAIKPAATKPPKPFRLKIR